MMPGLVIATFAAWIALVLVTLHPIHPAALVAGWRAWAPALPASDATWDHWRILASRLAAGHLGCLLWIPATAGFGRLALRLTRLSRLDRIDRWLLEGGLGAALAGAGWLGLGLDGLWFPVLGWLATATGLGGLALPTGPGSPRPALPPPAGTRLVDRALAFGLAVELAAAAVLVFGRTAVPDTAFDALFIHLARPARYITLHRIDSIPHLMPEFVPMTAVTLLGWPWLLVGEPAVRAWRFWLFAILVALVWRLAGSTGRPRAGLAAAVLAAANPQILRLAPTTMVDVDGSALVLLAAGCAWRSRQGARRGAWVALAGGLTGAALSSKVLTAFAAPGLLWAAAGSPRRGRFRRLVLFGLTAALPLSPWAVRNWIVVGNPAYPIVSDRMPTFGDVSTEVRARLRREWFARVSRRPAEWGVVPVRLADAGSDDFATGYGALLAAPLLLVSPAGGSAAVALAVGLPTLALWAAVTHLARYGLAGWLLLWVAVGAAAAPPPGRTRPSSRLGLAAIALAAFLALADASARRGGSLPDVWLGREAPEDRWNRTIPNGYGPAARWAADHLPADARLLLVGETRGAYWPRLATHDGPYEEQAISRLARRSRTPDELAHRLRQACTDLFVNDDEAARLTFGFGYPLFALGPRETALVSSFWRRWIDEEVRWGGQRIVRLRREPRRAGTAPEVPLCLRPAAFAATYNPPMTMTFQSADGVRSAVVPQPPR